MAAGSDAEREGRRHAPGDHEQDQHEIRETAPASSHIRTKDRRPGKVKLGCCPCRAGCMLNGQLRLPAGTWVTPGRQVERSRPACCGPIAHLAEDRFHQPLGRVDIHPPRIFSATPRRFLRAPPRAALPDVELHGGMAFAPPFASGSFDRVVSGLVFQSPHDREQATDPGEGARAASPKR